MIDKLFLILSLIVFQYSFGQTSYGKRCGLLAPESTCTKIEANGDITLTWTEVDDPNNTFLRYEIYSLESIFPLGILNTKTINSYTLDRTFINNHFYIGIVTLCNGSEVINYGDTIVKKALEGIKIDDGIELLQWNFQNNESNLVIQRDVNNANRWSTIDTIQNKILSFRDTVDVCNKNWLSYKIEIIENGCSSYTNLVSDSLKDSYSPIIPKIISAGYDTLNPGIQIQWNKNASNDVMGYILYLKNDNLSSTLDTIKHNNSTINTKYNFTNATSSITSEFRVAAYDYCISIAPKNQTSAQSEAVRTMLLDYQYDVCNRAINLNWNAYTHWEDIKLYRIYEKYDGKWTLIDSVSSLVYQKKLKPFKNYEFIIEAVTASNLKAFSSTINTYSNAPTPPIFHYTTNATIENNQVVINHIIDNTKGVKDLTLENIDNNLKKTIDKKKITSNTIQFIDTNVRPDLIPYTYQIQLIDSCNNPSIYSNIVKTILLNKNEVQDSSMTINLKWSEYIGFEGGIKEYAIYRKTNENEGYQLLKVIPNNILSYEDDLDNSEVNGEVCYYIQANESLNRYNLGSLSKSNTICAYITPRIYIPNSFTPGGTNPIFKPIVSNIDINTYKLSIIDRWGQLVFQTTDINKGWDGMIGNTTLSNGLYIYILLYQDSFGNQKNIRGLINLIK